MNRAAVEKEVLDMERQYWQAMQDQDAGAVERLTDDTCIVAGAQGVGQISNRDVAKMMKSPTYTLQSFELEEGAQVRLLSPDIAVVAYRVREELTVQGKPVTLKAADTSTWIRRDGRWRCASHTESVTGDPFGRDRTQSG
jgi:ketosteroid isomerase-like protein